MKRVGTICNYYGGVHIKKSKGNFYWIIENHDTDFNNIEEWEEISESLYNELKKH